MWFSTTGSTWPQRLRRMNLSFIDSGLFTEIWKWLSCPTYIAVWELNSEKQKNKGWEKGGDCVFSEICIQSQIIYFFVRYLNRFGSELEQIELHNSIKDRQGRRHCSRETIIKQTMERERQQFEGYGLGWWTWFSIVICLTLPKLHSRVRFVIQNFSFTYLFWFSYVEYMR